MNDNTLLYYPNNQNVEELSVTREDKQAIRIEIGDWGKSRAGS